MQPPEHRTEDHLERGLAFVREAPRDNGTVELIVRRPRVGEREVLEEATLDVEIGLVGDGWNVRPSSKTPDGLRHPEMQVTLMASRAIEVIAGERANWALAGDQLFVDLALGTDNLPPGTRLAIGSTILEVTAPPHTGCAKFTARFGSAAMRWMNTPIGRSMCLRGIHAKVIAGGVIRRGDTIRKCDAPATK